MISPSWKVLCDPLMTSLQACLRTVAFFRGKNAITVLKKKHSLKFNSLGKSRGLLAVPLTTFSISKHKRLQMPKFATCIYCRAYRVECRITI